MTPPILGLPARRPTPLTTQILAALTRLRIARAAGDADQEWAAGALLDALLDRYLQGQR